MSDRLIVSPLYCLFVYKYIDIQTNLLSSGNRIVGDPAKGENCVYYFYFDNHAFRVECQSTRLWRGGGYTVVALYDSVLRSAMTVKSSSNSGFSEKT